MPEDSALDDLVASIRACRLCRDKGGGDALPHEPRPIVVATKKAKILIAGQAPGTRVHASGVPFDDPSGDRLRQWLGVSRAQFYDSRNFAIVPMGFCFPGLNAKKADLPPRPECAPLWRSRLIGEMRQIELVLLIGQYAQAWHLGAKRQRTLTETVKNWRTYFDGADDETKTLALPHPSWRNSGWLKKNPWFSNELLPVLRQEVAKRIV